MPWISTLTFANFQHGALFKSDLRQAKAKVNKNPKLINCVPSDIYLFKVNTGNIRATCELCSKLTIKKPEQRNWHILVFPLSTLSKQLLGTVGLFSNQLEFFCSNTDDHWNCSGIFTDNFELIHCFLLFLPLLRP